jgi:excinuclease ABC subunit A
LLQRPIVLRGVSTHNLRSVDLDLPRGQLIVFCGVSGSGKTSLALDTLYAEGQRRYIESFSAYTRQFLERLEKPDAERIDGIPPAVAVTRKSISRSSRTTLGATTEAIDYLRLLLAKIGRTFCLTCGREVRRDTPQSAAARLEMLPEGTRYLVAFRREAATPEELETHIRELKEDGFVRTVVEGKTVNLSEAPENTLAGFALPATIHVIVDRLAAGAAPERIRDSLEIAFEKGEGACEAFVSIVSRHTPGAERSDHPSRGDFGIAQLPQPRRSDGARSVPTTMEIDGRPFERLAFNASLRCDDCGREYPAPEPRLFSFNSPLGACPRCEGFGNVLDVDMDLVVPDPTSRSARAPSPPGPRRLTLTSWKSCSRWRMITACRSMSPFGSSTSGS